MIVAITPNALIYPLYNVAINFDDFLSNFDKLKYISSDSNIFSPLLFDDVVDVLQNAECFPTSQIFKRYVESNGLNELIDYMDLANLFTRMLSNIENFSDRFGFFDAEAYDGFRPEKISSTPIADSIINNEIILCCYIMYLNSVEIKPLVDENLLIHDYEHMIDKVTLYKTDNDIIEEEDFNAKCVLFDSCDSIISSCDPDFMWNKSISIKDYTQAIVAKCKQVSNGKYIYNEEFSLGDNFINSLNSHQCSNDGKFSSTLLECMAKIILKTPKNPINIFYTDTTRKEARKRNNDIARRTHVTKSGLGLRLMFWELPCGKFEFANVGVKSELVIL